MTAIAAARLIQSPTPRFAKKKSSGHRDHADEHEDGRERAERDGEEALRDRRRRLDAELAEDEHEHDREPDEEHELAQDAGVPAEHGDRHALAFARVPPGERGDGEHDPCDQRRARRRARTALCPSAAPSASRESISARRHRVRSYAFRMSDEGREAAGEGVAGALGARRGADARPDAVRRSYQHHRARRRARIEHVRRTQAGGRALLGRAGAARRRLRRARDDDVARDRAPVRAVGAAGVTRAPGHGDRARRADRRRRAADARLECAPRARDRHVRALTSSGGTASRRTATDSPTSSARSSPCSASARSSPARTGSCCSSGRPCPTARPRSTSASSRTCRTSGRCSSRSSGAAWW